MMMISRLYLVAIVLLFTGYFGIKLFYDGVLNLPSGPHKTASLAFALLILCAFLSGAGGNSVRTSGLQPK